MNATGPDGDARGRLFVLSAPSGAGKSSLTRALVAREPRIALSVSHTTRAPRPGEVDGVHYHFVDDAEFDRMVSDGAFLEHARVFDRRYGTSRAAVEERLRAGSDLLLEIDWQGARQVKAAFPASVGVFILPPSIEVLRDRLEGRAQDAADTIENRMRAARSEISHVAEFDFVVVNEDFETALEALFGLIRNDPDRQHLRPAQLESLIAQLLA